jgi:hypothetical protein
MNQWLRFSRAYETNIAVTANSPKIVSGFIRFAPGANYNSPANYFQHYERFATILEGASRPFWRHPCLMRGREPGKFALFALGAELRR